MAGPLRALLEQVKWIGNRLVSPLRRGEGPNKFQLSSPDIATTTDDSSVGWGVRPPATLACPRCGSDILQRRALDPIDCSRCVAEFDHGEFSDLAFRHFVCPQCRGRMIHGRRHPGQFDVPQWATCRDCHYHWEFEHFYGRDRSGPRGKRIR